MTMNQVSGNGVTLKELERIEEAGHRSQSLAPEAVLRLNSSFERGTADKSECVYILSEMPYQPTSRRSGTSLSIGRKMPRLRSTLDPEAQPDFISRPTR
jgi:hypothetical protein